MNLKNKNVLITGAKGGIGRALIKEFAEKNANIYANIRKKDDEFDAFIKVIKNKYSAKIHTIYFDITDTKNMKKVVKDIFFEPKISIDILINNAGVAHGSYFQITPIAKIREIFEINFFAQMELTQFVLKLMTRQKLGSIVNIASVAGIDLNEGNCAYGVSKAALIAWTRTLALEIARNNIRINAIAPGLTNTKMAEKMEKKSGKEMIAASAMKRLAKPEEIAKAVLFLASNEASFINGQVIRVDGGMV